MSPLYPDYVGLLIGSTRYDALEFSAAGLSLPRWAAEGAGLHDLRRGDEREATLCIGGAGWEECYDVVLRVAARGPAHTGFAFVTLPPPVRRLLGRVPVGRDEVGVGSESGGFASWGGRPAPFAFARLVEREEPSRRLILPASEVVLALTQVRNRKNGPLPKTVPVKAPPMRSVPSRPLQLVSISVRESRTLPLGTLLFYGAALLAVLTLFWTVVLG